MPSWSVSLATIAELGRPYLLVRDPADTPAAFVVHLRSRVPGSIAHPDGGFLVAFGNACTHMGCSLVADGLTTMDYGPPDGPRPERIVCGPCPCHGTTFDLARQGLVVLGPATQNLPQLELTVDDTGAETVVRAERWRTEDPRSDTWPLTEGG